MFDRDNWQEIFATIKKNKLRTLLTCFGVFWGIFMLVIMIGSGRGLENGVTQEFGGTATNSFAVWAQRTSKPYKGMQPGRRFNYNNADYIALKQIPELEHIAPKNQLGGYRGNVNVTRGLQKADAGVMGAVPVLNKIHQLIPEQGRWLNELDQTEKRKVAVIGPRVYKVLFAKDENPIGQYISVNGIYFRVVGVLKQIGSGGNAEENAQAVYLPFSSFQQAFNFGDEVGWFEVTSRKDIPASFAEEKVIAMLKERHKIAPNDPTAIGHYNTEEEFNRLQGLFAGISILVWVVGTGTLIAGVIGVSNIMLIIVKERTREIGVRRALGAPPMHIAGQLIMESIFITALAGYAGLVMSVGLLELVASLIPSDGGGMFVAPGVDLNVALFALTILVAAGALAGLIPARKALAVSPVEALRYE
jgi:putative ABC transport system permease protein